MNSPCPARAHWGQNDRGVAHPTEYFPGGTRAIEICPGRYWTVCCHTTGGHKSPYSSFPLGVGEFLLPLLPTWKDLLPGTEEMTKFPEVDG